jgi:hypothetical protein
MPFIAESLLLSCCSILFFLWIPGCFLASWLDEKNESSLSSSFFWGWVLNAVLACSILPFVSSTAQLALYLKIGCWLFVGIALIIWRIQGHLANRLANLLRYCLSSFSPTHILLFCTSLLLYLSYVATHDLGFDDTSYIHYLFKVVNGIPFQTSLNPADQLPVEMANHPFFGVILGSLSVGIRGGVVFLYYLIGFLVLLHFLLLSYEHFIQKEKTTSEAIAGVGLIVVALIFCGLENYLNFGNYPAQQSKLLLLSALVCLLKPVKTESGISSSFWLGSALLCCATLHNLSLIIVYACIVPLFLPFALKQAKPFSSKIKVFAIILLFPLLTMPTVLHPTQGFIGNSKPFKLTVFTSVIKVMDSNDQMRKQNHPATATSGQIIQKGETAHPIIQTAKKIIQEAIPYEFIAVVAILLFSSFFFRLAVLKVLALIVAFLALAFNYCTVIPKQAVIAYYRSSPFLILHDLYQTRELWDSSTRYWSDPYTSLYLQILSQLDCRALPPLPELLAFSPLFKPGAENLAARMIESTSRDKWVLNSRYWGIEDFKRRDKRFQMKRSPSSGQFNGDQNDLFLFQTIIKNTLEIFKQKLHTPLLVASINKENQPPRNTKWSEYLVQTNKNALFYNDAAVFHLHGVSSGDRYQLKMKSQSREIKLISVLPEKSFDRREVTQKDTYKLRAIQSVQDAYLLLRIDGPGYGNDFDEMKSVNLEKLTAGANR